MKSRLIETGFLIQALGYCDDDDRREKLLNIIIDLVHSFPDNNDGTLLWLKTKLPNFGDNCYYDEESLDINLVNLLEKSAILGCKEAQYDFGCFLYEKNKKKDALFFYEKSAMQGYAPAQWVFGIDTLNGIGVDKDYEKGKFFIELSAGQGYEYALDFLIGSHGKGNSEFAIDDKEYNKWVFVKNLMNPEDVHE
jgi:hypothetical protein